MNIDHIGIAVKDINQAIQYWQNIFGYKQATEVVLNTRQKVLVSFMEKENSMTIKLIQPSEESSTLTNFIKKGGSLHHLCFKTDNLEEKIVELKGKGMLTLTPPQPGEAFDNNLIAFLFAKNNMNIELIDTDERAKRIE
jgi:methylmalonyl-CoA/ethylmalonyl-CoA epimerase